MLTGYGMGVMEEKRRNKRIDLECSLIVKRLGNDTTDAANGLTIELLNVSKSGIGFKCPEPLSIGEVYECYLTIWTKETIHAFIQIVRVQKNETDYSYGSIFIGMTETDTNRISIYSEFNDCDFNS